MTPGGETEHLALVAQRAEAEQSGDALVEPPRRGAGCVRRRQPRQGLVAEHPGGVVDTEVAYAVDGDDRRLVEAGAVGARHRVTGVVIEKPQPGVRTKALPGQEPRGPHVGFHVRLATHPLQRALHVPHGDVAHREATQTVTPGPEPPCELASAVRMPDAVFGEPVRDDGDAVDVAAGDAGDLQDALDRQTRQPAAVAFDPRQALLGQSRHDDAVVQQRRRSLVRGRDA